MDGIQGQTYSVIYDYLHISMAFCRAQPQANKLFLRFKKKQTAKNPRSYQARKSISPYIIFRIDSNQICYRMGLVF